MSTDNPWKTCATRIAYENAWMRIREDSVIRPDGREGIYAFVEKSVATGVIALTDDDQVYLVGQYRYPLKEYSWEIIEGGSEPGESPQLAAERELIEEAGVTAKRWQQLGGPVHLSNCISSELAYLFIAQDLTVGERAPEGTEVLEVRKVPFSQCLAMVDSGEIKDAMTIMALLRADRLRRKF